MRLLRNLAGLWLGVALLAAVAVAQNDDTPLGDVARQQSGKKATKSFDEDNFQRTAPAATTDAKSADSAKPDAAAKADAKGAEQEAAPSEDVKALEKELAELKQKRDVTTIQISRLRSSIENASDGDVRDSLSQNEATYKQVLEEINAKIPVVEKKLEAARAAQKSDSGADEEGKPAESKPEPAKTDQAK